ncbi:MAG: hypothetical protein V3U92_19710 [Cellulophaga sp.]
MNSTALAFAEYFTLKEYREKNKLKLCLSCTKKDYDRKLNHLFKHSRKQKINYIFVGPEKRS